MAVSIHIKKQELDAPRFRATVGDRQSVGRTMGEALDALTADWDSTLQEADIRIEPILNDESEEEPHLIQVNGIWVVAGGGSLSPEVSQRDFVAEMHEERERSLYEPFLPKQNNDENPS